MYLACVLKTAALSGVGVPAPCSSPKQRNESSSATPNIDALVKVGIELDQAYVFKFCSPTRCALQVCLL